MDQPVFPQEFVRTACPKVEDRVRTHDGEFGGWHLMRFAPKCLTEQQIRLIDKYPDPVCHPDFMVGKLYVIGPADCRLHSRGHVGYYVRQVGRNLELPMILLRDAYAEGVVMYDTALPDNMLPYDEEIDYGNP